MKMLRSLREKKKLTQQQVADLMGISRAAYGKWETGDREPDITTLVKLADYFAVTTDYLFGRPFAIITYDKNEERDAVDRVRVAMEQAVNRPVTRSETEALIDMYDRLTGSK